MKEKKPMKKWKKVVLIILGVFVSLFILVMIIGSSGDDTTTTTNSTTTAVQTTAATTSQTTQGIETTASTTVKKTTVKQTTAENKNSEKFIKEVKAAIQDQIGEGEAIKKVELKNKDLRIYVDLSKVDPAPFTLEMLAESRTSSITDAILELDEYDSLWNTITVDFGSIGSITNSKDNIETYQNQRYFAPENFELK